MAKKTFQPAAPRTEMIEIVEDKIRNANEVRGALFPSDDSRQSPAYRSLGETVTSLGDLRDKLSSAWDASTQKAVRDFVTEEYGRADALNTSRNDPALSEAERTARSKASMLHKNLAGAIDIFAHPGPY